MTGQISNETAKPIILVGIPQHIAEKYDVRAGLGSDREGTDLTRSLETAYVLTRKRDGREYHLFRNAHRRDLLFLMGFKPMNPNAKIGGYGWYLERIHDDRIELVAATMMK